MYWLKKPTLPVSVCGEDSAAVAIHGANVAATAVAMSATSSDAPDYLSDFADFDDSNEFDEFDDDFEFEEFDNDEFDK